MTEQAHIVIEIWFAWWLRPYLWLLETFCRASGGEPDWDRLDRVVAAAIRTRAR